MNECLRQCYCRGNTIRCRDLLPDPKVYLTKDIRNVMFHNITFDNENVFAGTPYLQDLILSQCRLQTDIFRDVLLANSQYLKTLTIHNLSVKYVESNAFRYQTKMRSLFLKDVTIHSLKSNSFNRLNLVVHLNLYGIGLYRIDNCTFCVMEIVSILNLSDNSISYLLTNAFVGIPKIAVIDLRQNPIKNIEQLAMHGQDVDFYVTQNYYCCFTQKRHRCVTFNTFPTKPDL